MHFIHRKHVVGVLKINSQTAKRHARTTKHNSGSDGEQINV